MNQASACKRVSSPAFRWINLPLEECCRHILHINAGVEKPLLRGVLKANEKKRICTILGRKTER
jgi:hypothetical protein